MVNIFKEKHSTTKTRGSGELVGKQMRVEINSLDHSGRGVVSDHHPVIFVDGVLPGEIVDITIKEQKPRFCRGEPLEILQASSARIEPFCPHFTQCGGCQM